MFAVINYFSNFIVVKELHDIMFKEILHELKNRVVLKHLTYMYVVA